MKHVLNGFSPDHYGTILLSAELDKHGQNQMLADELVTAFAAQAVKVKQIDYLKNVRQLSDGYLDPRCSFFVCFNGHGSELSVVTQKPHLTSAFEYYEKPLFDLMRAPPIHERMAHQAQSASACRNLLLTDYNQAFMARLLGLKNARFTPGITLRTASSQIPQKPFSNRSIDVLLPLGSTNSEAVRQRYAYALNHKDRVYREIFESVVTRAATDLRIDPVTETILALQEIQSAVNFASHDVTRLISSTMDFVKRERRRDLLQAVKHLPVTIVTNEDLAHDFPRSAFAVLPSRSGRELLQSMADAKSVVCSLAPQTGLHAGALSAFSTGAYVVSAPDEMLETNFAQEREMLIYRDAQELANALVQILSGDSNIETFAANGHRKAMERFNPAYLVSSILTTLSLQPR